MSSKSGRTSEAKLKPSSKIEKPRPLEKKGSQKELKNEQTVNPKKNMETKKKAQMLIGDQQKGNKSDRSIPNQQNQMKVSKSVSSSKILSAKDLPKENQLLQNDNVKKTTTLKKSGSQVNNSSIMTSPNNVYDSMHQFDQQQQKEEISSESSIDDDFDAILSPNVLQRLKEINQIGNEAVDLKKETETIISNNIEEWKRDRLEKEYKCLFYKTRELSEILNSMKQENTEQQRQAEIQRIAHAKLKEKFKSIKDIANEQKQQIINEQGQLLELQYKHEAVIKEVDQLRKANMNNDKTFQQQQQELSRLKVDKLNEKDELIEKVSMLNNEIKDKTVNEAKSKKEFEKYVQQSEGKIKILEKELSLLKDKQMEFDIENSKDHNQKKIDFEYLNSYYEEQLNAFKQKDIEREELLCQLQEERSQLNQQIDTLLNTNLKYEQNICGIQKSLKEDKGEQQKQKEELEILQVKYRTSTEMLEDIRKKYDSVKKQIFEKEEEIIALKNTQHGDKLQIENQNLTLQSQELTINSLRRDIIEEKAQRENAEKEGIQVKQESLKFERENKQLKSDMNYRQMDSQKISEQNIRQNEILKREIDTANTEKREQEILLKKKITKMNKLKEEYEIKLAKLNEKNQFLENEHFIQKKAAADNLKQILALQNIVDSSQQSTEILKQEVLQLENIINKMNQEKAEFEEINFGLRKQLEEMNEQITNTVKEKDDFKNRLQFSKFEIRKIKDDFCQKENSIRSTFEGQIQQYQMQTEQMVQKTVEDQEKRRVKNSKIKVLSDIKDLIKEHKGQFKESTYPLYQY